MQLTQSFDGSNSYGFYYLYCKYNFSATVTLSVETGKTDDPVPLPFPRDTCIHYLHST